MNEMFLLKMGEIVLKGLNRSTFKGKLHSNLTRRLRPVVIVEYDRVPYIYSLGNVRVTLDENIRGGSRVDLFLEDQIPLRPIMPAGHHILEVKYDEFLPDFLYEVMNLGSFRQTAFSKYYLCRQFTK